MATSPPTVAIVGALLVANTGLFVWLQSLFGPATPGHTTAAPGTVVVPTCPPCGPAGYSSGFLWLCCIAAFLAGAGFLAVGGCLVGLFGPGLFGFLLGRGAASTRRRDQSPEHRIVPYRRGSSSAPGDSDID